MAPLDGTVLVEASNLARHFAVPRSLADALAGRRPMVRAVDGVSLRLAPRETAAIVGESGCGKTTTARLLLRLLEPSAGSITFRGQDIAQLDREGMRGFRRQAQLVFQNPFDALNPRLTIRDSLVEPLRNMRIPRAEWDDRVALAMRRVRLGAAEGYLPRFPHELSGGQLQRVVLARALILEPSFLVADEPVSMLDVSVRAGILNLMREARETLGVAALYISHDLALVRYVCDRTLVMYLGRIVEEGPTEEVVRHPRHPYTRALVRAVPLPRVDQPRDPLPIKGNVPDARTPPSGCRFRDRCPVAVPRCAEEDPPLRPVGDGVLAACHLA
ncbi:ABC transporter ATP-binding protein [Falsiroseomonas sp.]|uniref:ABC transporter ATP-binding protein n=1 Tax=Falsiroseomonas sp. TaxID=2870721 RepID=UPI0035632DEA